MSSPPKDGQDGAISVTQEQKGRYDDADVELGRGGIGRVLLVMDRHLGREIAVKELLQRKGEHRVSSGSVVRFLREARITGQLEHPGIVPVYELGRRADGRLFYTMKRVRGRTLADAISACRTLADRLALLAHFEDVCHALAYAHSRNVIHRDLKPENIMLGEFGETVVLDWGLAKVRGEQDLRGAEIAHRVELLTDASAGHTMAGAAVGTPAYMSPEQAGGQVESLDERSDVWGLGAVLYEILTGDPPFGDAAPKEVLDRVKNAEVADPTELGVPAELASICLKALQKQPDERYSSARELGREVAAWRSGALVKAYQYRTSELIRRFMRRHRLGIALGLSVLLLLTVVGQQVRYAASVQVCERASQHLTGVWGPSRVQRIEAAFAGTGVVGAGAIAAQTSAALDTWAGEWVEAHNEACAATRVRGEQSERLLDLRMACLTGRRSHLEQLVLVLEEADEVTVERATSAVGALPSVALCADSGALEAIIPPDNEEQAAAAAALRKRVAEANSLRTTGRLADAIPVAEEAAKVADKLGYRPVQAEAQAGLGELRAQLGDYEVAGEHLKRAMWLAEAAGDDHLKLYAALNRMYYLSGFEEKQSERLELGLSLEATLERLGRPADQTAKWHLSMGTVYRGTEPTESLEHFEKGYAIAVEAYGTEHRLVASLEEALAFELTQAGRYEEAQAHYDHLLAFLQRDSGPKHVNTAAALFGLARLASKREQHEQVLAYVGRAVPIWEANLGPEHQNVGAATVLLAESERALGRNEAAFNHYQRAGDIFADVYGPDASVVALIRLDAAKTAAFLGRHDEAKGLLDGALPVLNSGDESAHNLAFASIVRAELYWQQGRRAEALAIVREMAAGGESEGKALAAAWLEEH